MAVLILSATILIVDDDKGLLRLIQRTLGRQGLRATTAGSDQEAISWLARNTPDLMLLELKLPDFEGMELVDRLASFNRSIPFLVITGQGDERVAVDMMKHGALDYVVKDADFLGFLPDVISRALHTVEKDKRLVEMEAALRRSEAQIFENSEHEQRRPEDGSQTQANERMKRLARHTPLALVQHYRSTFPGKKQAYLAGLHFPPAPASPAWPKNAKQFPKRG